MSNTFFYSVTAASLLSIAVPAVCQEVSNSRSVPLYRVTVVERSVDAVNYQYRAGPTTIDFHGTVLLSKGKGEAIVESRRGRTEVDARFSNIAAPTRFGREYLAYVLWAISPEGAPHNLGEIVPDVSDHGHLRVTTDLQVFGLIVTAEPYSSVREPSDVVVLENQVRPDTVGRVQPIQAKYELMPRGHYTWNVQEGLESAVTAAPKVSMPQYEALLELYQAQNAIGVAHAAGAEQYAPDILAKAQQAFERAQRLQSTKTNASLVVQSAREAAQTAEDARTIAERRKNSDQLAQARAEAVHAQQGKEQAEAAAHQAEAAAQQARADADAARAQAETERAPRTEVEASAVRLYAEQAQADRIQPTSAPGPEEARPQQSSQTQTRAQLLERINGVMAARDTPRGLVVAVSDSDFDRTALRPAATHALARLGGILASQPGLQVAVEGHTDSTSSEAIWSRRAVEVRNALIAAGLSANQAYSQDFGNSQPLASNATAAGRQENRRVEIVISGAPIGSLPIWDQTYDVAPR